MNHNCIALIVTLVLCVVLYIPFALYQDERVTWSFFAALALSPFFGGLVLYSSLRNLEEISRKQKNKSHII
jgi:hypothetical protein